MRRTDEKTGLLWGHGEDLSVIKMKQKNTENQKKKKKTTGQLGEIKVVHTS